MEIFFTSDTGSNLRGYFTNGGGLLRRAPLQNAEKVRENTRLFDAHGDRRPIAFCLV